MRGREQREARKKRGWGGNEKSKGTEVRKLEEKR